MQSKQPKKRVNVVKQKRFEIVNLTALGKGNEENEDEVAVEAVEAGETLIADRPATLVTLRRPRRDTDLQTFIVARLRHAK